MEKGKGATQMHVLHPHWIHQPKSSVTWWQKDA
jgi:hypothetical protein